MVIEPALTVPTTVPGSGLLVFPLREPWLPGPSAPRRGLTAAPARARAARRRRGARLLRLRQLHHGRFAGTQPRTCPRRRSGPPARRSRRACSDAASSWRMFRHTFCIGGNRCWPRGRPPPPAPRACGRRAPFEVAARAHRPRSSRVSTSALVTARPSATACVHGGARALDADDDRAQQTNGRGAGGGGWRAKSRRARARPRGAARPRRGPDASDAGLGAADDDDDIATCVRVRGLGPGALDVPGSPAVPPATIAATAGVGRRVCPDLARRARRSRRVLSRSAEVCVRQRRWRVDR